MVVICLYKEINIVSDRLVAGFNSHFCPYKYGDGYSDLYECKNEKGGICFIPDMGYVTSCISTLFPAASMSENNYFSQW